MEHAAVILVQAGRISVGHLERARGVWSCLKLVEEPAEAPLLPRSANDVDAFGQFLGDAVKRRYPDGVDARLVVPASWALIHDVEVPEGRFRPEAAQFEFEELVPVDLEELTCAVRRTGKNRALVVGVFTEAITGFFQRLEDCMVHIEFLTVDALVPVPNGSAHVGRLTTRLWLDERWMTIAQFRGDPHVPHSVRTVVRTATATQEHDRLHLRIAIAQRFPESSRWSVANFSRRPQDAAVAADLAGECLVESIETVEEPVRSVMEAVATGRNLLDLRQGALAVPDRWRAWPQHLRRAVVAAAVVLVVAGLRLRLDRGRYTDAAERFRGVQAQLYQQALPGSAVPPSAALRLRSERIKLEALTERPDDQGAARTESGLHAFQILHDVTSQIPASVKIHVQEIVLDGSGARLAGQTTSHNAAGDWVQAINRLSNLQAEPPRTKLRKDGTVEFRIHAARVGSDEQP